MQLTKNADFDLKNQLPRPVLKQNSLNGIKLMSHCQTKMSCKLNHNPSGFIHPKANIHFKNELAVSGQKSRESLKLKTSEYPVVAKTSSNHSLIYSFPSKAHGVHWFIPKARRDPFMHRNNFILLKRYTDVLFQIASKVYIEK